MKAKMRSGAYIQQTSDYKAFIPEDLPPNPPVAIPYERVGEANTALGQLNAMAQFLPTIDPIVAMYVRKEALLSSQIEGTQASLEDLFEYESDMPVTNASDVEEVVRYVEALNHGLHRLDEFPMSLRLIKEIHAILMKGTRHTPGEIRRSQNWIGRPGSTLGTATFVPPPHPIAKEALGNLELYLHNKSGLPPLVDCALIHYQFETIHPFLDGNGRVGRLLIPFFLQWKGLLMRPILYISLFFKLNRLEYYERLSEVRKSGDYEQWINFFLEAVISSAQSALETIGKILHLQQRYRNHLSGTTLTLFDFLFSKPLLSTNEASDKLNISYQSTRPHLFQLVDKGILKEITGNRRNQRFAFWEYLDLLSEGTGL